MIGVEVGAGGSPEDPEKLCDIAETLCFDESAAGAGDLGALVAAAAVRTVGGAFTDAASGDPNPGFPRVESAVNVIFVGVPDAFEIILTETKAIADTETGILSAEPGAVVVRLADEVEVVVPPGESFDFPGFGTVFAGSSTITEDDGLKIIQVDGATLESESFGHIVFGRAIAGLELANTSGGSFGGGGGCSATPGTRAGDGGLIVAALAVLAGLARRSRRKR